MITITTTMTPSTSSTTTTTTRTRHGVLFHANLGDGADPQLVVEVVLVLVARDVLVDLGGVLVLVLWMMRGRVVGVVSIVIADGGC
jgi:hypothetical protein